MTVRRIVNMTALTVPDAKGSVPLRQGRHGFWQP
jgi:hypothetical protein